MRSHPFIHVAVGVVRNQAGEILITRRPDHVHQGGLWEFPGGKLEAGESVEEALQRELQEEIGINVQQAAPFIKIRYDYGDRRVLLDVWNVSAYTGIERACEGQAMYWVQPGMLGGFTFPAANRPIINALQLPHHYAILEGTCLDEVMENCRRIIENGAELVQIRLKSLVKTEISQTLSGVTGMLRECDVTFLLNSDLAGSEAISAHGLHLSSHSLLAARVRPAGYSKIAASCHNLQEICHAEKIGVDFAVLGPVLKTSSHPEIAPMGWDSFSALVERVNIPVFALGGLSRCDLQQAQDAGAQGVAGISAFINRKIS